MIALKIFQIGIIMSHFCALPQYSTQNTGFGDIFDTKATNLDSALMTVLNVYSILAESKRITHNNYLLIVLFWVFMHRNFGNYENHKSVFLVSRLAHKFEPVIIIFMQMFPYVCAASESLTELIIAALIWNNILKCFLCLKEDC